MSPPRRALRAPNPFPEPYNPVRALRDAPPLSSRYEKTRRDPNAITNDLDEAQCRQLSTELSSQRSHRPVDHFRRGATMVSCLWILRKLRVMLRCSSRTVTCVNQRPLRLQRHTLRELFLTQQVTPPWEHRERLQLQLHGQPVPAMRTAPSLGRSPLHTKHNSRIGWRELDGSPPTMLFELVSLKLTFVWSDTYA
ncbi:hypothetical protein PI125_g21550 [Phytophthora idaei]|nr:hypothetical protein PI125_g21550 [Phytophthora idaei]